MTSTTPTPAPPRRGLFRRRSVRVAALVGAGLAVPAVAFAAWVLSATITTNITHTAASQSITGSACTDVNAGAVVYPGQQVASCVFYNDGNIPGWDAAANYAVTVTGTNVTSPQPGTITTREVSDGHRSVTVPVYAGDAGVDVSLTSVTLTFTPPAH